MAVERARLQPCRDRRAKGWLQPRRQTPSGPRLASPTCSMARLNPCPFLKLTAAADVHHIEE